MTARLTAIIRTPEPRVLDDPFFRLVEGGREGQHHFYRQERSRKGIDESTHPSTLAFSFIAFRLCKTIWPAKTLESDFAHWGPTFQTRLGDRIQIARRSGFWEVSVARHLNLHGQWLFFPATEADYPEIAQVLASRYFHGPGFGLE